MTTPRGLVISALLGISLFGDSFDDRHARDVAANPPDLQFSLSTPANQFHPGERIPITLAFSSSSPEKYQLDGATYDRSGRLPSEEFVIDPSDPADPYQDYFKSAIFGMAGGGLRGIAVLEPKPYEINLALTDWFRFDKAGRYRLYLKSRRLTRERAPSERTTDGQRLMTFAAVSNIIEIEILPPDAAWESAKLTEITGILTHPEAAPSANFFPPTIRSANEDLRYLATPGAVGLAFDLARTASQSPDMFALVGARDRGQMITAFDLYLADPDVAFTSWDIRLRALFSFLQNEPLKPNPASVISNVNTAPPVMAGLDLQPELQARLKRFQGVLEDEAARLIPQLAAKNAVARKACVKAIAEIIPDKAKLAGVIPADDYGLSREELISQFTHFPAEQQTELLETKWDLIRGPEMIPVLRVTLNKAAPKPYPDTSMALQSSNSPSLTDAALNRLYQLAPSEAMGVLSADLTAGQARFASVAVRFFPTEEIPRADPAFSALLKTNAAGVLPAVAKFGSANLLPEMRSLYQSRTWNCSDQESFFAYFFRTSPDFGKQAFARTAADRKEQGCVATLLDRISMVTWNQAIEAQAIAILNDSDPDAAVAAARVLAAHGRSEVEPVLWARLEKWSEKWRGRSDELMTNPITQAGSNQPESRLGTALFEAISSAKSWSLDEADRKKLVALCVDDACRTHRQDSHLGAIHIELSDGGLAYPAVIRIDGYAAPSIADLKTKLETYPDRTEFRWCPESPGWPGAATVGQQAQMFDDLSSFLSKRSMTIERCGQ